MTDVVIVDSGGANLASLAFALARIGASSQVSADPALIARAPRVILPGVGAAAPAMQRLREAGLVPILRARSMPLLGICLGMQLLFEYSDEGDTDTLGLLPGRVRALEAQPGCRVPHMGWNTVRAMGPEPLLAGLPDSSWFYFVHGYYVPGEASSVVALTDYGRPIGAVVRRGTIAGVQFHPERSSDAGRRILENFLESGA